MGIMELTVTMLERLRDEAYVWFCRQAVQQKLVSLERGQAASASAPPRFGMLPRDEQCETVPRAVQTTLDNEAALYDRLAQIVGIEEWLRPVLRQDVAAYLVDASLDFVHLRQVRARLEDWERSFESLPELLVAFARGLRTARLALAGAAGPAAGRRFARGLDALRNIAEPLEQLHHELLVIAGAVAELTQAGALGEIRVPVLPDFRRAAWVGRLAVLLPDQAVVAVTHVEKEVRAFLAGGAEVARARLEASRDVSTRLESALVERCWRELRVHARTRLVADRDLDDVLETLSQRYGRADFVGRQRALQADSFLAAS